MNGFSISSGNVSDISFTTKSFESNPIELTSNSIYQISIPVKSLGNYVLISGQMIFKNTNTQNSSTVLLNLYKNSSNSNNILEEIQFNIAAAAPASNGEMSIINICTSYTNEDVGFPNILNHIITLQTNTTGQTAYLEGYTLCFTQIDDNNIITELNKC